MKEDRHFFLASTILHT